MLIFEGPRTFPGPGSDRHDHTSSDLRRVGRDAERVERVEIAASAEFRKSPLFCPNLLSDKDLREFHRASGKYLKFWRIP